MEGGGGGVGGGVILLSTLTFPETFETPCMNLSCLMSIKGSYLSSDEAVWTFCHQTLVIMAEENRENVN